MYYGEELGMGTMPASQLKDAPIGPKRPRADDRDGARTPMQWNAGPKAGFTTGSPWLPIEASASEYNADSEKRNPDSLYAWYASLLKLRHDNSPFRDGNYLPLESGNTKVFAFGRKAGNNLALIVLNTSPGPQQVTVTGLPGQWPAFKSVLLASPSASAPANSVFSIAPYGVLIAATD